MLALYRVLFSALRRDLFANTLKNARLCSWIFSVIMRNYGRAHSKGVVAVN
jgi:hypothetical protein